MSHPHQTATVTPFAENATSTDIAGLTVENGTDAIAVYGQARITRDQAGLAQARALAAFFGAVTKVLQSDAGLPEKVEATGQVKAAPAPFG